MDKHPGRILLETLLPKMKERRAYFAEVTNLPSNDRFFITALGTLESIYLGRHLTPEERRSIDAYFHTIWCD